MFGKSYLQKFGPFIFIIGFLKNTTLILQYLTELFSFFCFSLNIVNALYFFQELYISQVFKLLSKVNHNFIFSSLLQMQLDHTLLKSNIYAFSLLIIFFPLILTRLFLFFLLYRCICCSFFSLSCINSSGFLFFQYKQQLSKFPVNHYLSYN